MLEDPKLIQKAPDVFRIIQKLPGADSLRISGFLSIRKIKFSSFPPISQIF